MRYPGAQWRPISVNFNAGGNHPRFIVAHIMQGTLAGTDAWFHDGQAQVSAHFGVGRDGTLFQWVDTNDTAWHAMAANTASIGVEHEGFAGTPLTEAQISADAKLVKWAHEAHGIPLVLANHPGDPGLAWHGLGQAAWGNHPDCPGSPIIGQRQAIISAAEGPQPVTEKDWTADGDTSLAALASGIKVPGTTPAQILRRTAMHSGFFPPPVASWVNDVFAGKIAATGPVPKGLVLRIPA